MLALCCHCFDTAFDFVCAASSGPQPRQLSLRDNWYACMLMRQRTCIHAPTVMALIAHHSEELIRPGCRGYALQRRLVAAHSTRGSERFFELLTSTCCCVDTLVDSLSLSLS